MTGRGSSWARFGGVSASAVAPESSPAQLAFPFFPLWIAAARVALLRLPAQADPAE